MKLFKTNIYLSLLISLLFLGCYPKPKLYEAEAPQHNVSAEGSGASSEVNHADHVHSSEHTVIVNEVLDTEKYSYLNVSEDENSYWIAIPRTEVVIGGTYHYQGGLLKRNFESKEYNRVFETIYLVSEVHLHSADGSSGEQASHGQASMKQDLMNITPANGSISLAELFSKRDSYKGKLIKITGKCVKVNPMIMGRNWIHLQDGSGDGLDLTVTTSENVQVNEVVTFEGTIALNKDFGAGYKYDIIMEQATLQ